MAIFNHTYRLECDSSRIGDNGVTSIVDQTTGGPMVIRQGEDVEIQIALFRASVMVTKTNISNINAKLYAPIGYIAVEWSNTTAQINASLTVGSWKRGADYLTAFRLSAAQTSSLVAGRYRLAISALLNNSPIDSSVGTVVFLNNVFDIVVNLAGVPPATPPTPGPPAAYTKAESDALYAPVSIVSSVTTVGNDINTLETWLSYAPSAPILFVSAATAQAFTSPQKATARSNISAEQATVSHSATLAAAGSYTPDPLTYRRFVLTLTGNGTIANAASIANWTPGVTYEFQLTQDATGGRIITWGFLYLSPTGAIINPQPNAVTRLLARSDGTNVHLWDQAPAEPPGLPTLWIHAGKRTAAAATFTLVTEVVSGLNVSQTGGPIGHVSLNGRAAFNMLGAQDLFYTSVRAAAAGAGCTIAVVFDSTSSAAIQFLCRMPSVGAEVAYNSANGLYIAGIGASAGNRTAIAFTPASAARWVFIGTIKGDGTAMVLDAQGYAAIGTSTAATPAVGVEHIGCNAGANFWNGRIMQAQVFHYALPWASMVALRRQLLAELG